ncbi:MAG: sulfotransferase domain-containing protein [Elainellaceae cyanobacterium]
MNQWDQFDTLICSLPKSGRTMLRYLLATYLNRVARLGFEDDLNLGLVVIPNFVVKERANHQYSPDDIFGVAKLLHDRQLPLIRACHFNPSEKIGEAAVMLLVRSPLDVIVSRYHEQKYRPGVGRQPFEGTITDYLKETDMLNTQVQYLNAWAEWSDRHPQRFWVTSYEELMADKRTAVLAILKFLSVPLDDDALAYALERSSFESMQQQAIANLGEAWAEKGKNPSVLRIRRGEVGGYQDDMTDAEIEFVMEYLEAQLCDRAKGFVPL